jgi:release factor glutamine methyltransferase
VKIRDALVESAGVLAAHHISNPRLTAEVLLAHCLGVEREYLIAHDDRELSPHDGGLINAAVSKRISGMPLQYITGRQEFYGYSFKVTPDVLIPRPETENIVDAVLEADPRQGVRIIDVGTGSGCIAITLAKEIEGAHVFAGDVSERALHVARDNARSLDTSVRLVCMDLLEAVEGEFDFIVSNLPYVPQDDIAGVQREVREHEPHVAVFAPADPIALYRRLAVSALERLRPGGQLIVEVALGMDKKVGSLFGSGWRRLPTRADLQGIPRTVVAQKNPGVR